jgi:hypothetical protein
MASIRKRIADFIDDYLDDSEVEDSDVDEESDSNGDASDEEIHTSNEVIIELTGKVKNVLLDSPIL